MRYLLFAFVVLIAVPAVAQEPDTLDPRGYFPLAVGNEWEYEARLHRPPNPDRPTDESRTEYLRFRIVGDGAGPDADRFALVEERFTEGGALLARDTAAVRYDEESASVLALETRPNDTTFERPAPYFACDLGLLDGNGVQGQWNWSYAYYLDEAEIAYWVPPFVREAVSPLVAKMFGNLGGGLFAAVHGVGFVAGGFYPDGCQLFCDSDEVTLTFAVVGDQTYGAPVVAVEEPPPGRGLRPLVVYPNPTSGGVTVEAAPYHDGTATVVVFDATGRRVRSMALPPSGTLSLDLAGLPPGVYLLRVGAQTGRIVVQ